LHGRRFPKTDKTILSRPHGAPSLAPWSSTSSLQRFQLGRAGRTGAGASKTDATTLFLGSQDPYDNLLLQLSGEKHFTLYAPSQRWWLYPTFPPGGHESSIMNDIRDVDLQRFPCFQFARPLTLTLRAGDVLLLPYGWWHQVQTTGRSLAINYWWTRDSIDACHRWP